MNRTELESTLIAKAHGDAAFRAQLIANPHQAIAAAFGHSIPESIAITVFEETAQSLCLVLPAQPRPDGEILEAELDSIAGGWGQNSRVGGPAIGPRPEPV